MSSTDAIREPFLDQRSEALATMSDAQLLRLIDKGQEQNQVHLQKNQEKINALPSGIQEANNNLVSRIAIRDASTESTLLVGAQLHEQLQECRRESCTARVCRSWKCACVGLLIGVGAGVGLAIWAYESDWG